MTGLSALTLLVVLVAGIGAGFLGYAVGASSLVSYPAMLALGIPPVVANATNTVGVIGTGIGGVLGARAELRGQRLRVITYVLIGSIGGVVGALLLLGFDPRVFELAVPPLILLSAVVIAVNPRGRSQSKQAVRDAERQLSQVGDDGFLPSRTVEDGRSAMISPDGDGVRPLSSDSWWVWLAVSAVAVYSGYFGAGAGTLVLAVLDAGRVGPFHKINALKTVIGAGANVTATIVFLTRGVVDWPAAIVMGIGCFVGSYIAPPITRRIPARVMRGAAVAAGVALAADLAFRAYR
ncbi:transporter [Bifidobacterium minimum]|uniref:Probable membrane transporter protein n=1 Tax=Bifidobacterium minimum TaxID=1693 RepID=A0A087BMU3_9BIFI|nr:sulfite exporter TauE/SafE family protein [Bifidobacterium minimum]KFI72343.1 transporter [Bifidobacterium minimum]